MSAAYSSTPSGIASFRVIRLQQRLPVNKTRFPHASDEEPARRHAVGDAPEMGAKGRAR